MRIVVIKENKASTFAFMIFPYGFFLNMEMDKYSEQDKFKALNQTWKPGSKDTPGDTRIPYQSAWFKF